MAEEKIPAKNQLRKCLSVSVRLCLSVCLSVFRNRGSQRIYRFLKAKVSFHINVQIHR